MIEHTKEFGLYFIMQAADNIQLRLDLPAETAKWEFIKKLGSKCENHV